MTPDPMTPDPIAPDPITECSVAAVITGDLSGAGAEVVLALAAAGDPRPGETLTLTVDGAEVPVHRLRGPHGSRLHRATAVPPGAVEIRYAADVTVGGTGTGSARPGEADPADVARTDTVPAGTASGDAMPAAVLPSTSRSHPDLLDRITYLRPSRYAPSDALFPVALATFGHLEGAELVRAVTTWVRDHLSYVPGSSRPTDGAVDTYLARAGVCRDYAHLAIALLRARDVPARLVSVYAPGLTPMDFHAVVEVWVDDGWYVVDPTGLAPRSTMVRIATGRDAADTAFMSVHGGDFRLDDLGVTAVAHHRAGVAADDDDGSRVLVRLS